MSRARHERGDDARDDGLPEEIVECLERYRDGRCPELAACLLEELALGSVRAGSDDARCTCFSLLRHWHGIDRTRRDPAAPRTVPLAPPRLVATSDGGREPRAPSIRSPMRRLRLIVGGSRTARS